MTNNTKPELVFLGYPHLLIDWHSIQYDGFSYRVG